MPDWVYSAISVVLLVAAAALLYWSLFHDRARGRQRCPKCWYDMGGAVADAEGKFKCSECGHPIDSNLALLRTRRRWLVSGMALCIFAASHAAWTRPRQKREGLWALVPNTLLVLFSPVGDAEWEQGDKDWKVFAPPPGSLIHRLITRLRTENLWAWQSQILASRIFAAHPDELAHMILVPDRWPLDTPLRVNLNPDYGHRLTGGDHPGVRVKMSGSDEWVSSRSDAFASNGPDEALVGVVAPHRSTVTLDVEIWHRDRRIWRGRLVRPIVAEGSVHDYLTGVDSDTAGHLIAACKPHLFVDSEDKGVYFAMIDPHDLAELGPPDYTMAIAVDVTRDGVVVGRSSIAFPNLSMLFAYSYMHSPIKGAPVKWLSEVPPNLDLDAATWQFRLRGDPSLAMTDYIPPASAARLNQEKINRYWAGELTIALTLGPVEHPFDEVPLR